MTTCRLDASLRILADRRRRLIIQQLRREPDGTTTFEALVERLCDGSSSEDGVDEWERTAMRLRHTHLPKLEDHGIVECDLRSGSVRYRPDDQVESILDSLPDQPTVTNPRR